MRKKYNAFLSYNKQDKQKVLEIAHWLREKQNLKVWLDIWNLIPGDDWQEEIEKALDQSECCVIFLGPNGLGNWQNEEMRTAIYEHVSLKTLRVIPVLLPNAFRPEKESQIPKFLRRLHWVNFENIANEPDALKQLVCGIKGSFPYHHSATTGLNICPFRGLEVFREEDAPFFFGREAEVQQLLDYFKTHRFIAIIGPSGSGKSSVIQAGLIPQLKSKYCLIKDFATINILRTTLFTPKERPLEELAFALRRLLIDTKIQTNTEEIVERLQKSEKSLHYISREICEATGAQQILLIADQFEEVFTQTKDERQREQFITNIIAAAETIGGPVTIIITMRSDFLGKCAAYSDLNTFVIDNLFQIGPLNEKNMARAIEEPPKLAGLVFEGGLASEIFRDAKGAPGELPLVEHALLELYERREGNKLTHGAYSDLGRIEGALTKRAETEYEKLTAQQKEIIQRILLFRLIQPGDGTEDTRRRATMEELLTIGEEPDLIYTIIKQWTDARLLTTTLDILKKQEMVEVAHEALIRKWKKLQEWLAKKRETVKLVGNLHKATEAWLRANKNKDYLFHGAHLIQVEELYKNQADCLTSSEIEFIQKGIIQRDLEFKQKELQRQRELEAIQKEKYFLKLQKENEEQIDSLKKQIGQMIKNYEISDTIIESFGTGLIILDTNFQIEGFNKGAEEVLGYQANEVIGKSLDDILPKAESEKLLRTIIASLDSHSLLNREMETTTKDGKITLIGYTITPKIAKNGSKSGCILSFRDISQLKQMHDEVIRMDRLAALGVLASGIAHEVRNPLAGIKLMAETLEEELEQNDTRREYVARIIRQINRLDELLRTLFSYGKPRQPICKLYRLKDMLTEVEILLNDRFVKKQINYIKVIQPDLHEVYADFHQIQQVFINLFLNAIEAMPNGGDIYVKAREIESFIYSRNRKRAEFSNNHSESLYVEITVEDTGVGIRPDQMNSIFDPFFTTKPQGTGLGLSIVYRILEEHNGTIRVDSKLNKGTKFTIILPTKSNSS